MAMSTSDFAIALRGGVRKKKKDGGPKVKKGSSKGRKVKTGIKY
jgi:hypothetical protein